MKLFLIGHNQTKVILSGSGWYLHASTAEEHIADPHIDVLFSLYRWRDDIITGYKSVLKYF